MSDRAAGLAALAPSETLTVETVESVRHWSDHMFSFRMTRPASFRFRAGEFVMLGMAGEKRPLLRPYSIVSPSWDESLEFLSVKLADGPLTSQLQKVQPGDQLFLGRKPTGTLVLDALEPGSRLFLLATGTGLAPFMSVLREPETWERFARVVLVHSVRTVADLAYRQELESFLADDPLVAEKAVQQLSYVPTVTREPFHTTARIQRLLQQGAIFEGVHGPAGLREKSDRVMICGSMALNREMAETLTNLGFREGSNANPGHFVVERAFVG